MTQHDDLHPAGMPEEQPAMELLDGADETAPAKSSTMTRLFRGGLYGVLLLSASALLAISAVPELSNYVTFIPDANNSACPFSAKADGASCTAHQVASLDGIKGSPCSSLSADETQVSLGGCCSKGKGKQSETLASVSSKGACCEDACPLAEAAAALFKESLPATLLTDEQLALLPEGEELD